MKRNLRSKIFLLAILWTNSVLGQKIGPFQFDRLPQNKQLFAREADDMAEIVVAGKVDPSQFKSISMVKFRNKSRVGFIKAELIYNQGGSAAFSLSTKIKAELAQYAIEIYGVKSATDSSLLTRREDIVGGDFYIIYGQSNAVAWEVDYTYRHEYCRTLGFAPEIGSMWGLSNDLGHWLVLQSITFWQEMKIITLTETLLMVHY